MTWMPLKRARSHSLPPAFTLLKSEFNDFLCATIGDEKNHAALTLLSVLSRQGVDPWQEAAKLNRLPRVTATQRLATLIAALPNGGWAKADAVPIAARLVALLPRRAAPPPRLAKRAAIRNLVARLLTPRRIGIVSLSIAFGASLIAVGFLLAQFP